MDEVDIIDERAGLCRRSGCFGPDRAALFVGAPGLLALLGADGLPEGGRVDCCTDALDWATRMAGETDAGDLEREFASRPVGDHGLALGRGTSGWVVQGMSPLTTRGDLLQAALEHVALAFVPPWQELAGRFPNVDELVISGPVVVAWPSMGALLADALGRTVTLWTEHETAREGAQLAPMGPVLRHDPGRHEAMRDLARRTDELARRLA